MIPVKTQNKNETSFSAISKEEQESSIKYTKEREITEGYHQRLIMSEPLFMGHYGGANQYPILSEAMMIAASPESVILSEFKAISKVFIKLNRGKKTWNYFKGLTGKGLTFSKKAVLWNKYKNDTQTILKVADKTFVIIGNTMGTRDIVKLITDPSNLNEKQKAAEKISQTRE